MLALATKLFQRENKPYKPNEFLKKLMKLYLSPLQQQCNWLMYRDQTKIWLPQKSLIVEDNLNELR